MTSTIVIPKTARSPFQIYLLGLIALSGVAIISGISHNMILEAMGKPYSSVWGFFLTVGSIFIFLGIYWPKDPVTGLIIERSGLVALGGSSLIWSVMVIWKTNTSGLFSSVLTFGLFLACFFQWKWVNHHVNRVIKVLNDK